MYKQLELSKGHESSRGWIACELDLHNGISLVMCE